MHPALDEPKMASRPETYPDPSAAPSNTTPFYAAAAADASTDLSQLRETHLAPQSPEYQPAQPSYQPNGPPSLPSPLRETHQSLAQGVLSISSAPFDSPGEPARKRTKVSRACDECRRKKIRCDAGPEPAAEPCSNCRKASTLCQFSREPMKRGPSKGYIKDLSDRLNALEHQNAQRQMAAFPEYQGGEVTQAQQEDYGRFEHRYTPPENGEAEGGRKRTYSAAEQGGYVREEGSASVLARHAQSVGAALYASPPGRRALSPSAVDQQRLREALGTLGQRRTSGAQTYESEGADVEPSAIQEWDEEIIDEYYRLIHQTFPLLPHSKNRLRQRLATCSNTLRSAFFVALDAAIRTSPATHLSALQDAPKATKKAAELISASQFENAANRSFAHGLIYIQTLILMALEADNHGPATMRGQLGPPRGEWIGRAIGMATHLKLNTVRSKERIGEGDADSDEKLGRRIWWILFILDRWHSSSTSTLLQVPENAASLEAEDQILFGDSMYHLARLSSILGHLSTILQQPAALMAAGSAAAPIITITIMGEIDRFRESVESILLGAPSLVHLSYWHVRLVVLRLTAATAPHELLPPAARMAAILNSSSTVITPLNHHFAALAALTLVELAAFDETRAAALAGVQDIAAALGARKGLMSREDSAGWDSAIRALVNRSGTLRAADAPVGEAEEQRRGTAEFDSSALARQGYLAALVTGPMAS